jgi:hypothetical protein
MTKGSGQKEAPQPSVFEMAYKGQKNALSSNVNQNMNRMAEQQYKDFKGESGNKKRTGGF